MLKKMLKKIDKSVSVPVMLKAIGALLILYLLMNTQRVWGNWMNILWVIIQPFLFGFALAYVMNPLVKYMQKKGVHKNLTIALLWVLLILLFVILILMLLPILYEKINEFILSLISGVQWISDTIKEMGQFKDFSLVNSLTDNIISLLGKYDDWMPEIVASLPGLMSTFLDMITNMLFTIIIAIYMLADFDRMKQNIKKAVRIFFPHCDMYLHEIDENVTVYLKSLVLLILIRFVEYCAFYYCIGHNDWLIVGILSAVGALVPYIGGIIANTVGILTGLTLPPVNLAVLIIGILILSNVDNYVISPIVHEKRSSVGPLLTLLAVFAGGIVYGIIGIMISVPLVIAIKTAAEVYRRQKEDMEHPLSEPANEDF